MKEFFTWTAIIAACCFGVYQCENSDWNKRNEEAQAAQQRADATPHVIREADGCKVYAFKAADNWHYFTRCGATVTTERNWTEKCGKSCTAHKSESIVTQGNT